MSEYQIIEVVERAASALSLLGFFIIASTYWLSPAFHNKLFNRLVYYASWGNMGSNIATLISVSGIKRQKSGEGKGLCKAQGFLIQW
jgi:hypothetical protein